ncbi:MAG: 3-deoxy-D-manno-octulosonic acid transferase [bacterium ADurb.Bin429]|nr:MAG: 3-deoxy-D-manno-octulosonic acid transferase [bacterium ADurb.Bin429]
MLIFLLYNLVLVLLSPLAVLVLLWRLLANGKSRKGFTEQMGCIAGRKLRGTAPRIWLHAVSVGETVAAKPIWEALLAALPGWELFHSTTTDTGQAQAQRMVGDRGQTVYFPFDFLPGVWLSLRAVRPQLVVLVETELWPNFLAVAKMLGCRVMLANGIISDRSLRGAARFSFLYRWMLSNIDCFCMQSQEDADRIIRLGADPDRVTVVGNTKFDQVLTEVPLGEQVTLRNALGLKRDEPTVVAGSTHPGEEEIVLQAFRQLKTAQPKIRLIIAPRATDRAQAVEELAVAHGFAVARRSKLATVPPPPDAVIILDTIGELARAYALCGVAFVGGSLAPIGGHNLLEPLGLGKAVLFGPHMHKTRDITNIVLDAGVGYQVADADELAARWIELMSTPRLRRKIAEQAKGVFAQHSGAAVRCAVIARKLLEVSGTIGLESEVHSPESEVPSPES